MREGLQYSEKQQNQSGEMCTIQHPYTQQAVQINDLIGAKQSVQQWNIQNNNVGFLKKKKLQFLDISTVASKGTIWTLNKPLQMKPEKLSKGSGTAAGLEVIFYEL